MAKIQPHHLQQLPKIPLKNHLEKKSDYVKTTFSTILQQQLAEKVELKISKHAEKRMKERGIQFSREQWSTIEEKISEAKKKGISDSLVLTNDSVLVVSAKNNTVITALDRTESNAHIFTNIDGAIIL